MWEATRGAVAELLIVKGYTIKDRKQKLFSAQSRILNLSNFKFALEIFRPDSTGRGSK
jgi:hypothetical protein